MPGGQLQFRGGCNSPFRANPPFFSFIHFSNLLFFPSLAFAILRFPPAGKWPPSLARRSGERCELLRWDPGREHFWYILSEGNVSGGNHVGSFCGNHNAHVKQNGCQFKLHYVTGPTACVMSTYFKSLGAIDEFGGSCPRVLPSYVPDNCLPWMDWFCGNT